MLCKLGFASGAMSAGTGATTGSLVRHLRKSIMRTLHVELRLGLELRMIEKRFGPTMFVIPAAKVLG